MAYPEPTPPIRGKKDAEEFYRRLRDFTLTPEQRKHFEDGVRRYRRMRAAEPEPPSA
jgi:hypothetical protein